MAFPALAHPIWRWGRAPAAVSDVLLALGSGCLFGGFLVAVRTALRGRASPAFGAFGLVVVALMVAVVASVVPGVDRHGLSAREVAGLLVAGAIVPGLSHVLFVRAIRDAGPSRSGVVVGAAPLVSVLIALAFLHEPFRPVAAVGAALIVSGSVALAWERSRPPGFKAIGLALAAMVAVLFAVRDNLVRATADGGGLPPARSTAVTLAAAAVVVSIILAFDERGRPRGRQLVAAVRAFAPAGLLFGTAYIALVAAFDHATVAVVSPLNATQSLWAILFSAALLGRTDAVGGRVVIAGVFVVLGAAAIGVSR